MICNIQWFVPETPPPKLGHSWVVFEGWPQILPSTKLFSHGFQRSCSVMTTQKFEKKVQQHDEVVESSKTGCRSQSSAHGKACEQVPALICNTYALRILCTATIWGGCFAQKEQNNPPKYLGNKSEIPHLNLSSSSPPELTRKIVEFFLYFPFHDSWIGISGLFQNVHLSVKFSCWLFLMHDTRQCRLPTQKRVFSQNLS